MHQRSQAAPWLAPLIAVALNVSAGAAPLQDLPPFESAGGELNLIVTAIPASVEFAGVQTTGWVYDVCRRASATTTDCLPGTSQRPYGGVRLSLQPNDTLRLRLVNKLPPVPDTAHCPHNPDLANNPTNLHTHGLIVEPHRAVGPGDPYGDYVFLEIRNPANASACTPPPTQARAATPHVAHAHAGVPGGAHPDTDVAQGAAEYAIQLVGHPSGLFWFHPHMHGLALNQVTSGLAGVITVGRFGDECRGDAECEAAVRTSNERVLVLKDSEVLAGGTLLNQQDAGFCAAIPAAGEPPRQGSCPGDIAGGFSGGRWFHTVNGQVYPDIHVGSGGDVWRIVNAAGSRSYDLFVAPDPGGGGVLPLQVLSIDGITIDATRATNLAALQVQFGSKVDLFPCPDPPGARHGEAVCTRHVRMMPSARVALRVLNNQTGVGHAVLRTANFPTGPDADNWPAIDLASVELDPPMPGLAAALNLGGGVRAALSPQGVLGRSPMVVAFGSLRPEPLDEVQRRAAGSRSTSVPSAAAPASTGGKLSQATEYAIDPRLKLGLRTDPACANLRPGEHRRIYFGNPTPGTDGFGLATAVIDARGRVKPGSETPMRVFDPTKTTICLTAAGAGAQRPTMERWKVLNLTGEDHNFHVHQTRFWLLSRGPTQPGRIDEIAVLQDNVPLTHAANVSGCDGSMKHYKSGACRPQPVMLRIPFTQIGDFVFHCHILEHEDGGMMARIRVVAPPVHVAGRG